MESGKERWSHGPERARFLIAVLVLVPIFALLALSYWAPRSDALVAGLLAALSTVVGGYFGSQGTRAAERATAVTRRAVAALGEGEADELRRLRSVAREYLTLLEMAEDDPVLDEKIQAMQRRVKRDDDGTEP
ncbi:MAG TPA: hypothetical protein VHH36_07210 [Candidatus Thermoplasmatota archaeon]|nr:hypothetical protein [Candidatus Thermoplasmatota archaeon]